VLIVITVVSFQTPSRVNWIVLTAAMILAAVSFLDDLRSLPSSLRFTCHAAAAFTALFALGWAPLTLEISTISLIQLPLALSSAIAILWLAGHTNAYNFMDGINGLAASQAAITGLGMALLTSAVSGPVSSAPVLLSLIIAGATLGFLPHNFPTARMFMGDVGSAPLGFFLATLVLWLARDHDWSLLIPLALLHANFVLDTSITLARRILRRDRWYTAHKEHFYQRLVRAGKSHTFVTLWEMALQVVVLILMVAYIYVSPGARIGLIMAVIAIWLAFFWYCESQFRRFCVNQT
jgi:UDP-N-acetylmuramyl pentapeptide phosphotransferase/UDP-N-acetylglucosamine-1-phosphate transferase